MNTDQIDLGQIIFNTMSVKIGFTSSFVCHCKGWWNTLLLNDHVHYFSNCIVGSSNNVQTHHKIMSSLLNALYTGWGGFWFRHMFWFGWTQMKGDCLYNHLFLWFTCTTIVCFHVVWVQFATAKKWMLNFVLMVFSRCYINVWEFKWWCVFISHNWCCSWASLSLEYSLLILHHAHY